MSKVNVRSATVPASMSGGRAMSVWSEMPMGPPDPILGLTGENSSKNGARCREGFPVCCVRVAST